MTKKSQDNISQYGVILEVCSKIGLAMPEEFLPCPKDQLAKELLIEYKFAKGQYKDTLGANLICLAGFVPMEDVVRCSRYVNYLGHIAGQGDLGTNFHEEDKSYAKDFERITIRFKEEQERLMKLLKTVDSKG